jgi:hypothetical protein
MLIIPEMKIKLSDNKENWAYSENIQNLCLIATKLGVCSLYVEWNLMYTDNTQISQRMRIQGTVCILKHTEWNYAYTDKMQNFSNIYIFTVVSQNMHNETVYILIIWGNELSANWE